MGQGWDGLGGYGVGLGDGWSAAAEQQTVRELQDADLDSAHNPLILVKHGADS